MVGGSGGRGGGSNVKRLEMLVVSLMGQIKLVLLPDWSPPGVTLKLMGVTLGGSSIG